MFRPMALTVVFALAASLVAGADPDAGAGVASSCRKVSREGAVALPLGEAVYGRVLDGAWSAAITVGVAVLVVLVSLAITPFLGAEFIPRLDEGAIAMQIWRLPSISLEESIAITHQDREGAARRVPRGDRAVVSRTGRAEIATDPMGVEISDIYIMLKPPETSGGSTSKEELVEAIEATVAKRGAGRHLQLLAADRAAGLRADRGRALGRRHQLYGDDLATAQDEGGRDRRGAVQQVPGAADVQGRADDRACRCCGCASTGRPSRATGSTPTTSSTWSRRSAGRTVGTVFEGQKRFPLQVRFGAAETRASLERIRGPARRRRRGGRGRSAAARAARAARRRHRRGRPGADQPREHQPADQRRGATCAGATSAAFVAEAQARGARPRSSCRPDTRSTWGGQFENLQRGIAPPGVARAARAAAHLPAALHDVQLGAARRADLPQRAARGDQRWHRRRSRCAATRSRSRRASASSPSSASRCSTASCWSPTSSSAASAASARDEAAARGGHWCGSGRC